MPNGIDGGHEQIHYMRTIPICIIMTKTLSFAAIHFTVAFSLVYLMTGSLMTGGLVALVEPCVNTLAFHLHEKLWTRRQTERTARAFPVLATA